jgi:PAS domain S-box-containing protein
VVNADMTDIQKYVLLVEDEAMIALLKKSELENFGYSVKHLSSGEKAVSYVLKNSTSPDLILMDIDLGQGIDGTEAAQQILAKKDIPIVFLSSHTEKKIVEKTENITSYGYVVKNSGTVVLDTSIKMAFKLFNEKKAVDKHQVQLEKMGALAHIGTWEYDITSSQLFLSNEVYKILELKISSSIDMQQFLDFYTDDSRSKMQQALNLAITNDKNFIREAEIETSSGKSKKVRTQGELVVSDSGKKIFGIIQDISEIRLLDQISHESELTLNQIEEITHIGHWSVNTVDGSIFHSDEIKRIFGYEPSEYALSVEEAINAYHPDDRDEVLRLFNIAVETGEGYEFDLRIVQPGGAIRQVHSKGYTQKDDSGKVIRVYGVFQDITHHKETEDALVKSNNELNNSLSLYHDLVETSQDLIWQCDHEGKYTYLNPAWTEVLGYEIEEMLGRPFSIFQAPEQAEKDMREFHTLMKGNTIKGLETIHLHKSGKKVRLVFNAKFLKDKDGNIAGTRGTAYDVTERYNTEQIIKNQLQEKETLIKEVHHRIKNNISAIKGLISFHISQSKNDEVKAVLFEAINKIESMQQIYEKLLLTGNYSEMSIKNYLEDLLTTIVEIFPNKDKIQLNTNITDFPISIKKLFPIGTLVNELITNSIKHGYEQHEDKPITISFITDKQQANLIISDKGKGIPKNFDYKKAKSSGLLLVNLLTEQLKGAIQIESSNGTQCTITFPINTE